MFVAAVCAMQGQVKYRLQARAPRNIRVWAAFIWMMASLRAIPNKTLPQLWREWPEARAFIGWRTDSALHKLSRRWGQSFMGVGSLEDEPRRKKSPRYLMPRHSELLHTSKQVIGCSSPAPRFASHSLSIATTRQLKWHAGTALNLRQSEPSMS